MHGLHSTYRAIPPSLFPSDGYPPSFLAPPIHHVCLCNIRRKQPLDIQHISIKGRSERRRNGGRQKRYEDSAPAKATRPYIISIWAGGDWRGEIHGPAPCPTLLAIALRRWLAAVAQSPSPLMLFSLYSAAATADGPLSRGRNGDSRVCPPAPLSSNERRPRDIGRGRIGGEARDRPLPARCAAPSPSLSLSLLGRTENRMRVCVQSYTDERTNDGLQELSANLPKTLKF